MDHWHEHQEKRLLVKVVRQAAGKCMTVTRPFNPTQISKARSADRGMTLKIPFQP
jgi:hypothetical protein